jgi:hypothetical protein
VDEFQSFRQEVVEAVAHDGVGLPAADLHEDPGMLANLSNFGAQSPSNVSIAVLVDVFHESSPSR